MVLRSPRRIRSQEVGRVVTFHCGRGMPIHTLYNLLQNFHFNNWSGSRHFSVVEQLCTIYDAVCEMGQYFLPLT